ncbi:MAG: hypothetical protein ACKO5N_05895 [Sphingomonadales bacterium]
MSAAKTNQKKLQEAFELLERKDQASLSAALFIYKEYGNLSILPTLFNALQGRERTQQQLILGFLADVNDSDAAEVFVNYLQDELVADARKLILSAIWNSKLPFDAHLPFFVMLATQGDYLEALDCLTIIENMAGPFEEAQLLEAQLLLKEYIEERAPQSDQKALIMSEIAWFVKEQNEGIDADLLIDND